MPERVETTIDFNAIEFRGRTPYTVVKVSVHWDDGESEIGAGSIRFELPVPHKAASDLPALRAAALAVVERALDTKLLRAWRGAPPESK